MNNVDIVLLREARYVAEVDQPILDAIIND